MGLGRFLKKTVNNVGRTVGKAFGTKGRGVSRNAPMERIIATASEVGKGVSQAQDPADVAQRMGQALGRSFKKGGSVSSGRGDGIAIRGKTKCKMY
jgi:hypothetical protein